MMERTVVSRNYLDEVIDDVGAPASWLALAVYDRHTVLVSALKNCQWKKYSKGWGHRINAWILPEVNANVSGS